MSRFVSLSRVVLMGFFSLCLFSGEKAQATIWKSAIEKGRQIAAAELSAEKQKNEELTKKIQDYEKDYSQKDGEIDSLSQQLTELKRRNKELEDQSIEVNRQLNQERDQNRETSQNIDHLTREITQLTEQLRLLESDLNKTQEEKELTAQEKQDLAKKIRQEEILREQVRMTLDTSRAELALLQERLAQSENHIQELESLRKSQDTQSQEIERLSLENEKRSKYIKKCQRMAAKVAATMGVDKASPLSLLTQLSTLKSDESLALFRSGARLSAALDDKEPMLPEQSKDPHGQRNDMVAPPHLDAENTLVKTISVFTNDTEQSQTLDALLSPPRLVIGRQPVVVGQVRVPGRGFPLKAQKKSHAIDREGDFEPSKNNDLSHPGNDHQPPSPLRQYQILPIISSSEPEEAAPSDVQNLDSDRREMAAPGFLTGVSTQVFNDTIQEKLNRSLSVSGLFMTVRDSDFMKLGPLGWVRAAYLNCLSAMLPEPVFNILLRQAEQTDEFCRSHMAKFGKPWLLPLQNQYKTAHYPDHLKIEALKRLALNGGKFIKKEEEVVMTRLSQNDAYGEPWIDNGGW